MPKKKLRISIDKRIAKSKKRLMKKPSVRKLFEFYYRKRLENAQLGKLATLHELREVLREMQKLEPKAFEGAQIIVKPLSEQGIQELKKVIADFSMTRTILVQEDAVKQVKIEKLQKPFTSPRDVYSYLPVEKQLQIRFKELVWQFQRECQRITYFKEKLKEMGVKRP